MRDERIQFAEFAITYLKLPIDTSKIIWDDCIRAYKAYNQSQMEEAELQKVVEKRPGLIYLNWFVSKHFKFDPYVVRKGEFKLQEITKVRQISQYIATVIFQYDPKTVGEFYGKNRTTILHSIKTVENEMATNKEYKLQVINLIEKLNDKKDS